LQLCSSIEILVSGIVYRYLLTKRRLSFFRKFRLFKKLVRRIKHNEKLIRKIRLRGIKNWRFYKKALRRCNNNKIKFKKIARRCKRIVLGIRRLRSNLKKIKGFWRGKRFKSRNSYEGIITNIGPRSMVTKRRSFRNKIALLVQQTAFTSFFSPSTKVFGDTVKKTLIFFLPVFFFQFSKSCVLKNQVTLSKYLLSLFFQKLVLWQCMFLFKRIKLFKNFLGRRERFLFLEFFLQRIIKYPLSLKAYKVKEVLLSKRRGLVKADIDYIFTRCFIPKRAVIFCKNFIQVLSYSIFFFNLMSLSSFFISEFYYRRRQRIFLISVEKILRFSRFRGLSFSGFCLLILGKLARRKPRARSVFFFKRKIPQLSALRLKVQYVYKQCISKFGSYGVKFWLYHY
jgi:hypothetical protein